MSLRLDSRAQIFSGDVVFAMVVFAFVLTASIIYSTNFGHIIIEQQERNELGKLGFLAGERLVLSQGEPANWENLAVIRDVKGIGLVSSQNLVDADKFTQMQSYASSDYSGLGQRMGIGGRGYYLSLRNLSGNSLIGELGQEPDMNSVVVSSKRIVLYDGNIALLDLRVHKP